MERVTSMLYRFQLREADVPLIGYSVSEEGSHMGGKRGPAGLLVLVAAFLVFAFGASPAKAAFGIADWQAVTCTENEDSPAVFGEKDIGFPPPPAAEQCTKDTPGKWFTQAAGHPDFGITDFMLNAFSSAPFINFPEGFIEEIVVDTPEGLGVNPEATTVKCTVEEPVSYTHL